MSTPDIFSSGLKSSKDLRFIPTLQPSSKADSIGPVFFSISENSARFAARSDLLLFLAI